MKLLSLRLCDHDANISYFDGEKVHYLKIERKIQKKYYAYNNLWEWRSTIKEVWDVDYKDIDEIAVVIDPDMHSLPPNSSNLYELYDYLPASCPVWRIDHHYAHSLSTWMLTEKSDVSIVIDGFGEKDVPWSVFKNNILVEKGSIEENGSIGQCMTVVGDKLEIQYRDDNEVAGKLMGLQSYGSVDNNFLLSLKDTSIYNINELFNEQRWIDYCNSGLISYHKRINWIKTVHKRVEDILVDFFKSHANKNDVITYTGGVAQNVIWNTRLKKEFPNLVIPPHCADDGLSLGALEWLRIKNKIKPFKFAKFPYCQSDLGTKRPKDTTIKKVAELLKEGKTVGWFQENGEIGPRALGNRSILFSPNVKNGKNIVNKIKKRETYRPFGATVLYEDSKKYFDIDFENPFMLYVADVKTNLECVTHIDNTCRIQTINNDDSSLYELLKEYKRLTGDSVLLNTSLNVNGRPIAGCSVDAIELFKNSDLNVLVIEDKIMEKPPIIDKDGTIHDKCGTPDCCGECETAGEYTHNHEKHNKKTIKKDQIIEI